MTIAKLIREVGSTFEWIANSEFVFAVFAILTSIPIIYSVLVSLWRFLRRSKDE